MRELERPYEYTQASRGHVRHVRDHSGPGQALRGPSRNIGVYEPSWADGPVCLTYDIVNAYARRCVRCGSPSDELMCFACLEIAELGGSHV